MHCLIWLRDRIRTVVHETSILDGTKHEQELFKSHESSAHVVKVLGRGTICLSENHSEDNFLYLHESYQIKISVLDAN